MTDLTKILESPKEGIVWAVVVGNEDDEVLEAIRKERGWTKSYLLRRALLSVLIENQKKVS